MSSDTPALEGETLDEEDTEPVGIIGGLALTYRWAYNNPVLGFGMDMIGIGTAAFASVVLFMLAIVTVSDFVGGWLGIYAIFVALFGGYGAYKKRHA